MERPSYLKTDSGSKLPLIKVSQGEFRLICAPDTEGCKERMKETQDPSGEKVMKKEHYIPFRSMNDLKIVDVEIYAGEKFTNLNIEVGSFYDPMETHSRISVSLNSRVASNFFKSIVNSNPVVPYDFIVFLDKETEATVLILKQEGKNVPFKWTRAWQENPETQDKNLPDVVEKTGLTGAKTYDYTDRDNYIGRAALDFCKDNGLTKAKQTEQDMPIF